jgi:hypothetical protein
MRKCFRNSTNYRNGGLGRKCHRRVTAFIRFLSTNDPQNFPPTILQFDKLLHEAEWLNIRSHDDFDVDFAGASQDLAAIVYPGWRVSGINSMDKKVIERIW